MANQVRTWEHRPKSRKRRMLRNIMMTDQLVLRMAHLHRRFMDARPVRLPTMRTWEFALCFLWRRQAVILLDVHTGQICANERSITDKKRNIWYQIRGTSQRL
jgi:hypothetical protein